MLTFRCFTAQNNDRTMQTSEIRLRLNKFVCYSCTKTCLPLAALYFIAQQNYAYQNKVTSQTTMVHVQFVTGILLIYF